MTKKYKNLNLKKKFQQTYKNFRNKKITKKKKRKKKFNKIMKNLIKM